MKLKRIYIYICLIFILICTCRVNAQKDSQNGQYSSSLEYIDPIIGNIAPLLNTNRPVIMMPNQMIRVFPNRQDYLDMQITDFPLTALNIITPQMIFAVKPSNGEVNDTGWYRRMTYDHDLEITKPWYYATQLMDDGILTEFTAGNKVGIYRFTFPKGVQKNVLLSHYYEGGTYTINGNTISGKEMVEDAIHQQKGVAYMYGEVGGSPRSGIKEGEKDWGKYTVILSPPKPKRMNGQRAWFSYSANDLNTVEFRYAISFISEGQAKENFKKELTNTTFEQLENRNKKVWNRVVKQVQVEGGSKSQKRSFYTNLYRCFARMVNMSEYGKYFSAYDSTVHTNSRNFYTDDYSWGNYMALHPLRIILDPKREGDMLQSYVDMYEQSGWMPEYPKFFGDRAGMFAFHSAIMFLDAYRKGVRNFDVKKGLEGNMKNELQATLLPSANGTKGALEDFYYANGYYPALSLGEKETDPLALLKRRKRSSVAVTLGDSYDSWAASQLAAAIGDRADANSLAKRALNYKNLWNNKEQMFLPKDANSNWIEIDPKWEGADYYNENNGWSYLWNVQHDIQGLTALMGGPKGLENKLDQFFTEDLGGSRRQFLSRFPDQTSQIGQFGMGNQVSFFIPYLYNYTNSPWKTQRYTRFILNTFFTDNALQTPGDEDGGSMSAFAVFSAMGFYPVTPGKTKYAITSPLFAKVSIHLDNGKTFTVIADKCSDKNKYIQSATLNGKELKSLFFTHADLLNGSTIKLEMGEKTNTKWEIQY